MSVNLTSNFLSHARGFTLADGGGITWSINKATNAITATATATGALSSVGLSDSSAVPLYTVGNSPLTANGTLTLTLNTQTQKTFLAGPTSGSAAQPTFRSIAVADVPTLNQNTSGTAAGLSATLAISSGGTGQTSAAAAFNALSPLTTTGDLLIATGTNLAGRLAVGSNGYLLTVTGGLPTWEAVPTWNQNTTGNAATATSATTATNIAGGAAGSIPYQTALGATSLLATASGVLVGGTTPAWSTTPTLTGTNFTGIPYSAMTGTVPTWNQNTTGTAAGLSSTLAVGSGGTGQTTAAAAYNALSPMTTKGDIEYESSAGVAARLAIGSASNVLLVTGSGVPGWGTVPNAGLTNSSLTVTAGTGLSGGGSVSLGGSVTLANAGVTSAVAGTGVNVSGATGAVTLTVDQSFSPTWTGSHTFSTAPSMSGAGIRGGSIPVGALADPSVGTFSPSFTGLTVNNGSGGATYSGYYSKVGNLVVWSVYISVTGSATTASTAGSTYINNLPLTPTMPSACMVCNDTTVASIGVGSVKYGATDAFLPTWSATNSNIVISGAYTA